MLPNVSCNKNPTEARLLMRQLSLFSRRRPKLTIREHDRVAKHDLCCGRVVLQGLNYKCL